MNCYRCGNKISGNYTKFNNKNYCQKCGVRCARCDKKITEIYSKEDKIPYCKECFAVIYNLKCESCGMVLEEYVIFQGKKYCHKCYLDLFGKCENCGKELSRYYEKDGKKYCKDCFRKIHGIKCSLCGKRLLQSIISEGKHYCRTCFNSQKCISCRQPVGNDGIDLGENQYSCQECYKNSVLNDKDLYAVYKFVRDKINNILNFNIPEIEQIKLVNLKELRKVKRWASRNIKGSYHTNYKGKKTMFILKGLSKDIALGTIAHELAHYYQDLNHFNSNKQMVYEGFAEWVGYKVLKSLNMEKQIKHIENNTYKSYSDGLKMYVNMEKKKGIEGVMDYFRKHTINN